uniref:EF-hand calcium-binding domain-containing protein 6 n=1 Tax=Schistosoma haematobium TaxID=6185 RepID=A0A095A1R0_SCHHA
MKRLNSVPPYTFIQLRYLQVSHVHTTKIMTINVENELNSIKQANIIVPSFITTTDEDNEKLINNNNNAPLKSDRESRSCQSRLLKRNRSINSVTSRQNDNETILNNSENQLIIPNSIGIPHIIGNVFTRNNDSLQSSMKTDLHRIRFPSVDRIPYSSTKRTSRISTSTFSSNRSTISSNARFDIDEIIFTLHEKATHNYRELRHNFIINDPMGVGNLRREALARVLTRLLYWPVKQKHITQILSQLGFPKDKQIINFTEFYAALCPQNNNNNNSNYYEYKPTSINKTDDLYNNNNNSKHSNFSNNDKQPVPKEQTITQIENSNTLVLVNQADKSISNHVNNTTKQNWSFLTELPHDTSRKSNFLLAHQVMSILRQRLLKGTLQLDNLFNLNNLNEQNQLIQRDEFFHQLSRLGLYLSNSEFLRFWKRLSPKNEPNLPIECFLNHMNLRNNSDNSSAHNNNQLQSNDTLLGYRNVCKAIEHCTKQYIHKYEANSITLNNDLYNIPYGYTNSDIFLETLKYLKLTKLEKIQLGSFFTRYGLTITNKGLLPYAELFRRFQDRSEAGVLHQMLTYTLMTRKGSTGEQNENIIQLEHELIRKFHRDFLTSLNTFRSETCEPGLNDQCQTDNFNLSSTVISNNTNNDKQQLLTEQAEYKPDNEIQESSVNPIPPRQRTVKELEQIIREALKAKTHEIENKFYELDQYNSGRLTQEQLYHLLKVSNIRPEITRGEIRRLWPEFFVDQKHCLSFHEFMRHFLYRKSEAAYPNAKFVPPRLGDADLMPCSNKLNGVTCLIKDSLRAKIDFMFDRLYKEFIEMDPKGTGFITPKQLNDILIELCLQVSDREIDDLIEKFDIHKDGKISYLALLQPFIRNRLLKSDLLHNKSVIHNLANKILGVKEVNKLKSSLLPILNEVRPKVQVSQLNWSKMRRSMQKADKTNCGRLDAPIFRDLYQHGTGIRLTDEQVYQLLTTLDPDISGTLPYKRLLEDTQPIFSHHERKHSSKLQKVEENCSNINEHYDQQIDEQENNSNIS